MQCRYINCYFRDTANTNFRPPRLSNPANFSWHAHNTSISSRVLNFSSRCRKVVSFRYRPLCLRENGCQYRLNTTQWDPLFQARGKSLGTAKNRTTIYRSYKIRKLQLDKIDTRRVNWYVGNISDETGSGSCPKQCCIISIGKPSDYSNRYLLSLFERPNTSINNLRRC